MIEILYSDFVNFTEILFSFSNILSVKYCMFLCYTYILILCLRTVIYIYLMNMLHAFVFIKNPSFGKIIKTNQNIILWFIVELNELQLSCKQTHDIKN